MSLNELHDSFGYNSKTFIEELKMIKIPENWGINMIRKSQGVIEIIEFKDNMQNVIRAEDMDGNQVKLKIYSPDRLIDELIVPDWKSAREEILQRMTTFDSQKAEKRLKALENQLDTIKSFKESDITPDTTPVAKGPLGNIYVITDGDVLKVIEESNGEKSVVEEIPIENEEKQRRKLAVDISNKYNSLLKDLGLLSRTVGEADRAYKQIAGKLRYGKLFFSRFKNLGVSLDSASEELATFNK